MFPLPLYILYPSFALPSLLPFFSLICTSLLIHPVSVSCTSFSPHIPSPRMLLLPLYPSHPVSLFPYIPLSLYPLPPCFLFSCIPLTLYPATSASFCVPVSLFPCISLTLYPAPSAPFCIPVSLLFGTNSPGFWTVLLLSIIVTRSITFEEGGGGLGGLRGEE
jgi:hypothetical protein